MTNTSTDEWLRKELLRLGAREYEVVALTMDPRRGESALRYALMKGAEHPIAYAIKLFDTEEWHPSGETHRRGTNLDAGPPSRLPPMLREANLAHSREILKRLSSDE